MTANSYITSFLKTQKYPNSLRSALITLNNDFFQLTDLRESISMERLRLGEIICVDLVGREVCLKVRVRVLEPSSGPASQICVQHTALSLRHAAWLQAKPGSLN